jgi:hypothetical protein
MTPARRSVAARVRAQFVAVLRIVGIVIALGVFLPLLLVALLIELLRTKQQEGRWRRGWWTGASPRRA